MKAGLQTECTKCKAAAYPKKAYAAHSIRQQAPANSRVALCMIQDNMKLHYCVTLNSFSSHPWAGKHYLKHLSISSSALAIHCSSESEPNGQDPSYARGLKSGELGSMHPGTRFSLQGSPYTQNKKEWKTMTARSQPIEEIAFSNHVSFCFSHAVRNEIEHINLLPLSQLRTTLFESEKITLSQAPSALNSSVKSYKQGALEF